MLPCCDGEIKLYIKKKPKDKNIMSASATQGGHKKAAWPPHRDSHRLF